MMVGAYRAQPSLIVKLVPRPPADIDDGLIFEPTPQSRLAASRTDGSRI
jgi:hypothetical protein